MDFFKKNPEIEGTIVVQGKLFDDKTVVSGDKYKIFADPNTFPGTVVKLVKIDLSEMTQSQKKEADKDWKEQQNEPPKHLGLTTSDSIGAPSVGGITIASQPQSSVPSKKTSKVVSKPKVVVSITKKQPKKMMEIYSEQELIKTFAGITEKNVKKILGVEKTLKEFSEMSNSELRKMGVSPSFFGQIRDKARKLSEKVEED